MGFDHEILAQDRRLETGAGVPLQTESLKLVIPPIRLAPMLTFDFAFATAETSAPGVFLDSLSFSVQTLDQKQLAVLLTMDAFGLKLAPAMPGGVPLNANALKAVSIAYFGSLADPAQRSAFHVSLNIPGEFADRDAELLMDLFDNGDGQKSVGTLANAAVVFVPEPSVLVLGVVGLFLMFSRKVSRR